MLTKRFIFDYVCNVDEDVQRLLDRIKQLENEVETIKKANKTRKTGKVEKVEVKIKRKPGRPKGSKNKAKK